MWGNGLPAGSTERREKVPPPHTEALSRTGACQRFAFLQIGGLVDRRPTRSPLRDASGYLLTILSACRPRGCRGWPSGCCWRTLTGNDLQSRTALPPWWPGWAARSHRTSPPVWNHKRETFKQRIRHSIIFRILDFNNVGRKKNLY